VAKTNAPSLPGSKIFPPEYYASLLTGLVHKLNNIMTVLSGHSGLLEMEGDLPKDVEQSVRQMSTAVRTLSRYLDESIMVAKAPVLILEPNPIRAALFGIEGIELKKSSHSDVAVLADARKLRLVFEQIVQNAFEAEAKRVELQVEVRGEMVALRFKDDGRGMKPTVLSRAFDPFYTTKKDAKNFGLGLFRIKGELARMNGEISMTSDGKSWTEVLVILPNAARP
jgi:two-component system cell cycle sensor histidine kinase/response regulator CckA